MEAELAKMRERLQSLQKQFNAQHARPSPWRAQREGGRTAANAASPGILPIPVGAVMAGPQQGVALPCSQVAAGPADSSDTSLGLTASLPAWAAAEPRAAADMLPFSASTVLQENPMFNCTPTSSLGTGTVLSQQRQATGGSFGLFVGGPAFRNAMFGSATPGLSPLPTVAPLPRRPGGGVAGSPGSSEITMAAMVGSDEAGREDADEVQGRQVGTGRPHVGAAAGVAAAHPHRRGGGGGGVGGSRRPPASLPHHSPPQRVSPSCFALPGKKMKPTLPQFR